MLIFTGVLFACSSDDTSVGGGDSGTPDAADGSFDSPTTDTGTDTGSDADAGKVPVGDFTAKVANALCTSLVRCCYDGSAPDGGGDAGTFDQGYCMNLFTAAGFENSNVGEQYVDAGGGTVVLNPTKAADCLAKLDALPCSITGAQLKAAREACFAAFEGQLAAGSSCVSSIQCQTGLFCDKAADAGATDTGKCAALHAQGDSCNIVNTGDDAIDSQLSEEACSYRASGSPALQCLSYDNVGYLPRDQWKCAPQTATGQVCNSTVSCADGICDIDQGYICVNPGDYFAQACANPAFIKH